MTDKERIAELEKLLQEKEEQFKKEQEKHEKEIEKLNKEHEIEKENAAQKYSALECEFAKLQEEFNKFLIELEKKNQIIRINAHNKFVGTKENGDIIEEKSPVNEVEVNLSKPKKKGRPQGSKNFDGFDFEKLATVTVTNDIADDLIKKGYKIKRFDKGNDISYLIRVRKEIEVIRVITPKYVRIDVKDGKIYQATSKSKFPHSCITPSFVADIITAKYYLDVPIDRYAKYLKSMGLPFSAMNLTNYVKRADELLQPVYNAIKNSLINTPAEVIHVDETPIEVLDYLKRKGEDHRKNGYIFVYVTSYYDNPIYLYDFSGTRETHKTQSMLKDYHKYLVADGYAGYDILKENDIKIQLCFAHIRRKFYDIKKTLSEEALKKSVAAEMVRRIDRLFHEESKMKKNKLSPKEIGEYRKTEKYMKIVNDIYSYLAEINPEKGTKLEEAVKYFRNGLEDSKTFLLDGHIPLSNNVAERAVKPFTILRSNMLFAKNEKGAEISARLFTIIQTARANGIRVEEYLTYLLENVGEIDVNDLLPWSEKIPENLKVK